MPITIYPTTLKYKDSTGTFQSATALKGDSGEAIVEQVNGTAPTITCEANHRYICNEVSALNITPSASGVCEIIFTSGSNATALTAPNTIKWPEWFSPDALEPNATYSFKISNNLANVAIWPEEGLTGDTRVRIQKMLGIYEPPWVLLNNITLQEEGRIDLSADQNGTPYNLLGVYVHVFYPANNSSASTGYGRYRFIDSNDKYISAETGRYTTKTNTYEKFVYILRKGQLAIATYATSASTGGGMAWQHKSVYSNGYSFDFKNIKQISMNTEDVEPAGTRIQIYGQWAY